jgi:hypothetical protein
VRILLCLNLKTKLVDTGCILISSPSLWHLDDNKEDIERLMTHFISLESGDSWSLSWECCSLQCTRIWWLNTNTQWGSSAFPQLNRTKKEPADQNSQQLRLWSLSNEVELHVKNKIGLYQGDDLFTESLTYSSPNHQHNLGTACRLYVWVARPAMTIDVEVLLR